MGIKTTQNLTLISNLLKRNAKKVPVIGKKVSEIGVCPLLYYLLTKVIFVCALFPIISTNFKLA